MLTEVPAFQFQSRLLAAVPVDLVLNVSMVLLAARLAAYSLLAHAPSPWLVLPIELLHGAAGRAGREGQERRPANRKAAARPHQGAAGVSAPCRRA